MGTRGSAEFRRIRAERMAEIGHCELCHSKVGLELHHCIPLVAGGEDTDDNLILVCRGCHARLTPKSTLIKIGMNKTPDILISRARVFEEVDEKECTKASEVLEIINEIAEKYPNEKMETELYDEYQREVYNNDVSAICAAGRKKEKICTSQ